MKRIPGYIEKQTEKRTCSIIFLFSLSCAVSAAPLTTRPNYATAHEILNTIEEPFRYDSMPLVLPGTKHLTWDHSPLDMSRKMLEGAHQLIDQKIQNAILSREKSWSRDFRSRDAYEKSIEPNLRRFMDAIGLKNQPIPTRNHGARVSGDRPRVSMQKFSLNGDSDVVAETSSYRIYQVRWPVSDEVFGEGLLAVPTSKIKGNIVAIPDAGQTPEELVGLSPGIAHESQFARRLAENGYQVLIPVLISRDVLFAGEPKQQTHREWLYRQAFHMGRHVIGYEVQKVMAAVDWFKGSGDTNTKVGVAGYCEGGLIAMYAAAVDKRIDAVLVSGYFNTRERVWDEPIYRNVWGLLTEFGDAEIVSMIAPRPVVIEYSAITEELEASTRKPVSYKMYSYSGYKGSLQTPAYTEVETEFLRIKKLSKSNFQERHLITGKGNNPVGFGSRAAMETFTTVLGDQSALLLSDNIPIDTRTSFDSQERQIRQLKEIERDIQELVRDSDTERYNFFLYNILPEFGQRKWSTKRYHPYFSPDTFMLQAEKYRTLFNEEILGKFDDTFLPPNARTRKVYDEELWAGYKVVLDVYDHLIAPGILLLPKDIKPGEKRPVVVCQHGRNGVPQALIEGNTSYYNMAAKLADQGFIVYAPYGIFNGEDRYRWLDRKANALKKTMFSFIVSQHDQTLRWLGSLPFVDEKRIAFYGKSYGGETAMRVPAVLKGYCLSICSADFGDWTRKVADTHFQKSFMHSIEWEMPYFNMGSTFSYAEMAYLIFPRPFMVERGRHDLVQPDEFVAYEYAKVSFFYDQFNLSDRTSIEFFNGGHASRNEGTFEFLHKHLDWP